MKKDAPEEVVDGFGAKFAKLSALKSDSIVILLDACAPFMELHLFYCSATPANHPETGLGVAIPLSIPSNAVSASY